MIPKITKKRKPLYFLPTEKTTFDVYLHSVDRMKQFMFADLQKGIDAKANFLVAGALSSYTEVWGRLVEGIPEKQSRLCYESFFRRLGKCYGKLLDEGVDAYHDVRCGLVHSYAINGKLSMINMGTGPCGIENDNGGYKFNVGTYFEDFKRAVTEYIILLQKDMPVHGLSLPGYTAPYSVKNPLHANLFDALSHKSIVI